MSRAAAEKREEREEAFKAGLGAGRTDRRAQDAERVRKDKRGSALTKRRGLERPNTDDALTRMMSLYRREQLVATGDPTQLRLLHDILERANTEFFNDDERQALSYLLGNDVMPVLVREAATKLDCAIILKQLTGIVCKYEVRIAQSAVRAGFLNMMAQNARQPICWDIAFNIALSCREARNEILASSFFASGAFIAAAPHVPAAQVLSLCCALIEADDSDPPAALIHWVWPLATSTLAERVQPRPWLDLDEGERTLINASTGILLSTLHGFNIQKRSDVNERLFSMPCAGAGLIRRLLELVRACKDMGLEVRILEIMVRLSALPVPTHDFHLAMRAAGAVRDMLTAVARPSAAARYYGYLWIGNYMADGVQFVRELLTAGVMPLLAEAMERDQADIKAKAIYAVMTMFVACADDQDGDGGGAELLHTLVQGHRIFARLAEHLTAQPGQEQLCVDILRCLARALQWNRGLITTSLRAYHVADHIEDVVTQLKGHTHTQLYELAVEVDDLLHGRAPENREAALEAATTAATHMDTNVDGLYVGRFDF